MAEFSILHTTSTSGDGAATYTEAQATDAFGDFLTPNSTITAPHATQGVYAGAGGELAVTGTASPVSVASGAAAVAGFLYRNTAAVTVAIPTPAGSTRIDRIVLRMSWSAHTVRITRIAGTEGGAAPAITQTDNTTWDIKLAQVSITTGGVCTVTDERTFCHFATRLDKNQVDGGTATRVPFFDANGRLTDDSGGPFVDATNDRFALGNATPSHQIQAQGAGQATAALTDAGATGGAFYARDTGGAGSNGGAYYFGASQGWWAAIKGILTNGAGPLGDIVLALRNLTSDTALTEMFRFGRSGQLTITPPAAASPIVLGANGQGQLVTGLNADKVDGLDLGLNRQGGSATAWATPGSTNYAPSNVRVQVGARSITVTAGTTGTVTITFPTAFSDLPLCVATLNAAVVAYDGVTVGIAGNAATTALISVANPTGSDITITVNWMAIGPM